MALYLLGGKVDCSPPTKDIKCCSFVPLRILYSSDSPIARKLGEMMENKVPRDNQVPVYSQPLHEKCAA